LHQEEDLALEGVHFEQPKLGDQKAVLLELVEELGH
jgi:hypothetical protein